MELNFKITALALCTAILMSGCAGKSSVEPNKNPIDNDDSGSSDSYSQDEGGSVDAVIDNVDDSEATGKVYSQTIMVYMVGSDLESAHGAATLDLVEMENALSETGEHNIAVCAGGASQWQNTLISGEEQSLLELRNGAFTVVDTLDSKNMGEAENLGSFISQCMEHYDTDLYSLILWNHGAGPVLGFGVDENYNDIMSLTEMQSALENSVGKSGKKLEWIGFDACLMSSLEICDAFQPYANYLIASQETEPGWGWNYEFLESLSQPDMNGARLGKEIIDTYMSYGEEIFEISPNAYSDLTLSCLDLNKYEAAEKAFNDFFTETKGTLTPETFPKAVRDGRSVKSFGGFSSNYSYCLVDAYNMAEILAIDDSYTKHPLFQALEDMTVYMRSNVKNAHGVSVCYPYSGEEEYTDYCMELQEYMGFAPEYTDYLNNLYAIRDGEVLTEDWDVSQADYEVHNVAVTTDTEEEQNPAAATVSKDICLQLTEEQKKNFGSAAFYILCNAKASGYVDEAEDSRADDMYIFVHGGKNVALDEAGVLHAYYSNNVVYMKDNTENELSNIPMVLIDNNSSSEEKRYMTSVVLSNMDGDIEDWNIQAANLQVVVDSKHPNGEIRNVVPIISEDEVQRASKQLLSLDDFTYMSVSGRCSYVTRDDNGNMLPFFSWEESGSLMGFEQDLTHEYSLDVRAIENPENYVCMFIVTDSQGNQSVSELIPLG